MSDLVDQSVWMHAFNFRMVMYNRTFLKKDTIFNSFFFHRPSSHDQVHPPGNSTFDRGGILFPFNICPNLSLFVCFYNCQINRANDEYLILTPKGDERKYKLIVQELGIELFYMELAQHIVLEHHRLLNSGRFVMLPYNKIIVNNFTDNSKLTFIQQRNIYMGNLPKMIFITLMDHANFLGTYNKNPFCFNHNGVKNIYLRINNNQPFPSGGYAQDFSNDSYILSYRKFCDHIGES